MRHFKGGISYLSGLFSKNGPKQTLLCCQLCLSLGCHLSYQNIARTNLGTDTDNSTLIQIL